MLGGRSTGSEGPKVTNNAGRNVAVVGGGPAGLMAAEVLAAGRRQRHGVRPHALAGKEAPSGRARRPEPDPQRGAGRFPVALRRHAGPAAAGHRGIAAASGARLVRSARSTDLRRLQRPRFSQGDESLATAAGLAGAARRLRRRVPHALPLARLGRGRASAYSPRPRETRPSPPTRLCWRLGEPAGRASARPATGHRCSPRKASPWRRCGRPIAGSSSPGRRRSAAVSRASR